MTDQPDLELNGSPDDGEMSDALRSGLRQAGYHVMRAGYELLAGVSAFLDAIGGAEDETAIDDPSEAQRIEVE